MSITPSRGAANRSTPPQQVVARRAHAVARGKDPVRRPRGGRSHRRRHRGGRVPRDPGKRHGVVARDAAVAVLGHEEHVPGREGRDPGGHGDERATEREVADPIEGAAEAEGEQGENGREPRAAVRAEVDARPRPPPPSARSAGPSDRRRPPVRARRQPTTRARARATRTAGRSTTRTGRRGRPRARRRARQQRGHRDHDRDDPERCGAAREARVLGIGASPHADAPAPRPRRTRPPLPTTGPGEPVGDGAEDQRHERRQRDRRGRAAPRARATGAPRRRRRGGRSRRGQRPPRRLEAQAEGPADRAVVGMELAGVGQEQVGHRGLDGGRGGLVVGEADGLGEPVAEHGGELDPSADRTRG